MRVSRNVNGTKALRSLRLIDKRILQLNEKSLNDRSVLIIKNCVIDNLNLKEVELRSVEISGCKIKRLELESIQKLEELLILDSNIEHLSFIRNVGFEHVNLEGVTLKEGKFLQNNGSPNSSISIDLETNKMNKLDVMYNYARSFDLKVSGKMRSLHLRRNSFENIEFRNASSPHTSVKVKSA